jgi:hypothetical protein
VTTRRRARWALVVAGAVYLSAVASATPAVATFTSAHPVANLSVTTNSLAAPTGASASGGCNGLLGYHVSLSWTATSSTWADGYQIARSTTNGGPYTVVATVPGRTTTTYTNTGLALLTTYYYVIRATKHTWTSPNSNQASATTPLLCV